MPPQTPVDLSGRSVLVTGASGGLGSLISRGLAEAGRLDDPRCADALDFLESKRLPDGGWAADGRYWSPPGGGKGTPPERVDWGPVRAGVRNEWVTAHALAVLTAAGRFSPDPD